jgi:hypothetical protein
VFEIERGAGFQLGKTFQLRLRIRAPAQIVFDEMESALLDSGDLLRRLSIDGDESSTQGLMPDKNPVQRLPQGRAVKIPLQAQTERYMIGLAHPIHLRQKPQPLLRK